MNTKITNETIVAAANEEKEKTTPEDFRVYGLEKIQPAYAAFEGKMYAGMLPMDNNGRAGMTMFWLFLPDHQEIPDSMVMWLNGGPGCSSFNCGVMMENSPVTQPLHAAGYCCLQPTPDMGVNEHSWTKATTMLYVEHPIGTGFSYGHPYPENELEASTDLDAFLQNFFRVFADLQNHKFYVVGESYAGMFVPAVSRVIHRANQASATYNVVEEDRIMVRLAGAALGNGWIDPKIQGPATIDYSWWHGLIDQPTRDALHTEWKNCMTHLEQQQQQGATDNEEDEPPPFHAFNVQDDCGIMWGILQAAGNPNAYDVTTWDPNVDQITWTSEAFYNRDDVKEALHVLNKEHFWHGCQAGSGRRRTRRLLVQQQRHRKLYMDNDRPLSVVPYIAELLDEAQIPVVVYNGDRDMTTNMVGSELCLNGMEWSGSDEWLDAPRGLWKVNDYPAGWVKEWNNLTFAVVYNSGHMVPYNMPDSAYDLLTRLLTHQSFLDAESPQIRVNPAVKNLAQENRAGVVDSSGRVSAEDEDASILSASVIGNSGTTSMINEGLVVDGSNIGQRHGSTAVAVLAALLCGFILGALFVSRRFGGHHHRRSGNYQPVPNASTS